MGSGEFFELMGILLTVIAILILAYVCTRYMTKLKLGKFGRAAAGAHMHILDQLVIGQDSRLLLVQAGPRYLLLAASGSAVSLLAELSEEDASLWLSDPQDQATTSSGDGNPSFRDSLIETLKQRRK